MAPTILLVDDSSIIREAVRMTLNKTQFRLIAASTAEEAFARLEEERVDLALIDLRLPDADGYSLCRRIKNMEAYADLPVLILTHINENIDRNRSREAGALGSFPKPFDTQDLLDQLQMILEDRISSAAEEEEISELDLEEVVEFNDDEEIFTTDRILADAGIERVSTSEDSPVTLSKEQAAALLEPLEEDDEEEEEAEIVAEQADVEFEEDIRVEDEFVSNEPHPSNIHSYFADENRKLEALRNMPLSEIDKQDEKSGAAFAYNLVEERAHKSEAGNGIELENWAADDLDFVEPISDDGIEISGMDSVEPELEEVDIVPETEADWMAREIAREISDGFESAEDDIADEKLPSGLFEDDAQHITVEEETQAVGDEILAGVEKDIEQSMLDDLIEHSPATVAEEDRMAKIPENMVEFAPVEELSVPAEETKHAPASQSESPSDIVELFRRAMREELAGLPQAGKAAAQQAPEIDIEKIRLAIVPELKTYLKQTVREEIASALSERRAPRYLEDFKDSLKAEILHEVRQLMNEKPSGSAFDPAALEGIIKDAVAAAPQKTQEPDLKMLASVVRKSIQMEIGKEIGERAQSVAWEVVPELAEILIKNEIGKLNR